MVIFSLFTKKDPRLKLINAKKQGKNIQYLLKSHKGLQLLQDYAEKYHIEETVMFLQSVLKYKKLLLLKKVESFFIYDEIIQKHIHCNSLYEINIPDEMRKKIKNINNVSYLTIFDEAYDEIEKLFWMNVLIPPMNTQYTRKSMTNSPLSEIQSTCKWFNRKICTI